VDVRTIYKRDSMEKEVTDQSITISRAVAVYELNRNRRLDPAVAKSIEAIIYKLYAQNDESDTLILPKEYAHLFSPISINIPAEHRARHMEAVYLRFLTEQGQELENLKHALERLSFRHTLNTTMIVLLGLTCVGMMVNFFL
jgi:DNA-binding protein